MIVGLVGMDGSDWKSRRKLVVRKMFSNINGRMERNIRRELSQFVSELDGAMKTMDTTSISSTSGRNVEAVAVAAVEAVHVEEVTGKVPLSISSQKTLFLSTKELDVLLTCYTGKVIFTLLFGEHWHGSISDQELVATRQLNYDFSRNAIILNHYALKLIEYGSLYLLFDFSFDNDFYFHVYFCSKLIFFVDLATLRGFKGKIYCYFVRINKTHLL